MSDDQDKRKPKFNLPPPPPPPPSIEEITRERQAARSSQAGLQDAYAPDAMAAALQQENHQLLQALEQARQMIVAKDSELTSFNTSFKEVQVQLAQVGDVLKAKDSEIEGLRSRVETHAAVMKNKDGEASRWKAKYDLVEETISRSKQDALAFQRKVEGFQKESAKSNEALKAVTAEKAELQAKLDEASKQSQAKLDEASKQSQAKLDEALKRSQADVEALRAENARIKDQLLMHEAQVKDKEMKAFTLQDEMATLKDKLVAEIESKKAVESKLSTTSLRVIIGSDAIIKLFNELLEKALHNVMFVVPTLKELQQLDLKKIKPSVKATACVKFEVASKEELKIVEDIQKQYRIDIRAFNLDDRYGINVDRGFVFIGVNSKTEPFGLLTENTEAIDLFMRQFIIECWTRGRPINIHP
jgi:chromosome segregation ATPase